MTRASLINLAIYSEAPESLPKNTQLISQITENHACRAIVIGANPAAKENRVEAWISAHCHVSRAGSKQVCSEQLSFLLEGRSANLLPNIVFSQLDSDLPLCLWWQDEFPDPMDSQLWAWVDRLIYDSQTWKDFQSQLRLVQTAQAEARQLDAPCPPSPRISPIFRSSCFAPSSGRDEMRSYRTRAGISLDRDPARRLARRPTRVR
jgi:hypothetical protein